MNLLKIKNLTHRFSNGTTAVKNINIVINTGEFIVLAGKNGSGKTVLARHMNGLLLPTSGEVLLENKPVKDNLVWARQKIGLVFQNSDSQIVGQTVKEDVAFGPQNIGLSEKEIIKRVKQSLDTVELTELADRRSHLLSGGEKRKLGIAGVLAMEPEIIILDEPFSGLDYPAVRHILTKILSLHKKGHTIIIITHDIEKVLAHADRLIIMDKGTVVQDEVPEKVIDTVEKYGIKGLSKTGSIGLMTWLK